jgi:hypothetical protein
LRIAQFVATRIVQYSSATTRSGWRCGAGRNQEHEPMSPSARVTFAFFVSAFLYLTNSGPCFAKVSQQDLVLRTTFGGAYGRYLVRNNQNSLRWLLGAVYTRANYQSGLSQPTQQNEELLVGVEYQLFHFDRYTLQSQFLVFPGLSDFGRVRFTTSDILSISCPTTSTWIFHFGTISTAGRP